MANKCTIELPVSIGDKIYLKKKKIINCRYFGDEYAREDRTPNCLQHEYDCGAPEDGGLPCNAEYEYYIQEVEVDDWILSDFAEAVIKDELNELLEKYALTREEMFDYLDKNNN